MLLEAPYKAWTTYSYTPLFYWLLDQGDTIFMHIYLFLDFTLWIVIPKNKNHEQDPFWKF